MPIYAYKCSECGHVEECTHCSITMTYHRTDEQLRCHLCGSERAAPVACLAAGVCSHFTVCCAAARVAIW